MAENQTENAVQFICPVSLTQDNPAAANGIAPYFNGKEVCCKFDPVATVYTINIPKEQTLRVHQVGTMPSPRFANTCAFANVTTIAFCPPILSSRNLFYLTAQLPKAVAVELCFFSRTLEPLEYHLHLDGNNSELLNKNISRFTMIVDTKGFRQQGEDIRMQLNTLIGNILRLAIICLPGIRYLSLELPDDPTHFMYIGVYDMINRIPALNQAIIVSDPYNRKV